MAGLKTLIRLKKHALDDKRRQLTDFEIALERLQNEDKRVLSELQAEQKAASERGEPSYTLAAYSERIRQRRFLLADNIQKLEIQIISVREEMQDLFKELKTLEITQENRRQRALKEQTQRENQEMDEIALQQFTRKQDN